MFIDYFFTLFFFFFNDTATTEIYTLSLHDALPILPVLVEVVVVLGVAPELRAPVLARHELGEPFVEPHVRPVFGRGVVAEPLVRELVRRSEEHTSELQSRLHLVCRLLLEKKKRCEDIGTAP